MKKLYVLSLVVGLAVIAGCGGSPTETIATAEVNVEEAAAPPEEVRNDIVYICACGEDCDCKTVAVEPGNCACGNELKSAHLVKVEGNEGLLCTCSEGCACEINAEDETKCTCGSDLKRVSFEGTGLYYCNCGGSCTCNHVAAEAGKCGCGMDLVTSTT